MPQPTEYPQLTPQTLRCANGALYLLMALAVVAAAAYAALSGRLVGPLQLGLAGGGCVLALVWAAYYALLRFRVGPSGVERGVLLRRRQPWAALRGGSIYRRDEQGVMVCRIALEFEGASWCISSELFEPQAVLDLAAALEDAHVLQSVPQK